MKWKAEDIKKAQRDFSYNFMRLDCIRTESYDVAIDCMTECIEKKDIERLSEFEEAKRLLKLAVKDIEELLGAMYTCSYCKYEHKKCETCAERKTQYCKGKWRYADEAEKLLKEEK